MVSSAPHAVKSSGLLGRGHRKKTTSLKVTEHTDASESSIPDSALSDSHVYKVNQDGRYICQLCEKTFKTVSLISEGVYCGEMLPARLI